MRDFQSLLELKDSYVKEFVRLYKEEGQTGLTDYYHGVIVGLTLAIGQDSIIRGWTDMVSDSKSMYDFLCLTKGAK